jgi:ABC-type multidrug transport system fused ATPase/permease subunit
LPLPLGERATVASPENAVPPVRATAHFWRLVRYVRPYLLILLLAIACSVVYAGARAGRAWLIQPVLDDVILPHVQSGSGSAELGGWFGSWLGGEAPGAAEGPPAQGEALEPTAEAPHPEALRAQVRESLPRVLLAALLIVLILPVAHFGQEYLSQYTLGRVLVDIQRQLCAKLLTLPLRFHHGTARGETLSRVTNDASRAHRALDLLFADVVQSVLALAVGGAILISISWQLTLITVLVTPIVTGVIAIFGRRIRKSAQRRQESQGEVTDRLLQILNGIKIIKAFRAQDNEEAAFQRHNLRYFRRSMRVVKNRALSRSMVEALNNGIGIAVLFVGAMLVMNGHFGLTLGALVAFVGVMQTTYRPVKDLTKGWTQLMEAVPSAERFFELLDKEPDTEDVSGAPRVDGVRQGIRIAKVSFSYGREPVLRDVSLDVAAGEVVAIVGRTGSGKTTLADLLLRFYDPDSGAIEVDGVDLRKIARRSWLEHVAVVTQDPFLFSGTIRENIRYGRPEASEAEVRAAARAAHVEEFAALLPDGYDTDVGEAGVRLSGGQRQRITIARAILKNPSVLIFDEATSALDAKSERYVQEAIERLLSGRTVFVIAHRLSTVRHADKIVVMESGAIAEIGTHDELMLRDGPYRELMSIQSESPAREEGRDPAARPRRESTPA